MSEPSKRRRWKRPVLLSLAALPVVIQLVPFGRDHENPPVVKEPAWDRPETRELAVRACFDCHSNETRWPWYSHIAPMSWAVQQHVDDGRRHLNFSEWQRTYKDADEAHQVVTDGEMPLPMYVLAHPEARLSPEETKALSQGLAASVGGK